MTNPRRSIAAVGSAALLALSLAACSSGPPTDASVEDYCAVVNDNSALESVAPDDYEGFAEALKEQADNITEVGTPEDMPEDAREGFEVTLDAVGEIDGDLMEKAMSEDVDLNEELFSEDAQAAVEAYQAYENETCQGTPE